VEALQRLRQIGARNQVFTSLIGQGYYGTHTPLVILRNILENPAWYTAYTPYQPEISQGRLEALLNYPDHDRRDDRARCRQRLIAGRSNRSRRGHGGRAAGVEVQEQSLLRGCRLPSAVHRGDAYARRAAGLGTDRRQPATDLDPNAVFGAILQYPDTFGQIRDWREVIANLRNAGALSIVAADPLSLALLTPPGELGADIAIGSTQRFGVPMGFGGPHAAYMAVKDAHKRSIPGRLIGVSVDSRGQPAYRLALQTREQHIRRDKATSNICTAQVLLAVMASMYAVYHGPEGLRSIAHDVHRRTATLAAGLRRLALRRIRTPSSIRSRSTSVASAPPSSSMR
jgi:glycine dehydrogenase